MNVNYVYLNKHYKNEIESILFELYDAFTSYNISYSDLKHYPLGTYDKLKKIIMTEVEKILQDHNCKISSEILDGTKIYFRKRMFDRSCLHSDEYLTFCVIIEEENVCIDTASFEVDYGEKTYDDVQIVLSTKAQLNLISKFDIDKYLTKDVLITLLLEKDMITPNVKKLISFICNNQEFFYRNRINDIIDKVNAERLMRELKDE